MKNASTAAVVWWKVAAALGECTSSAWSVTFYSSCRAKVSQSQIMKPPGQKVGRPPRLCPPLSASYCLTMSVSDRFVCIPFILIKSMFHIFNAFFSRCTYSHTMLSHILAYPLRSQCKHVLLLHTFLLHLLHVKPPNGDLGRSGG